MARVESEHGTLAGWTTHVRHKHPVCQACRDARNEYDRAYRRQRRALRKTQQVKGTNG